MIISAAVTAISGTLTNEALQAATAAVGEELSGHEAALTRRGEAAKESASAAEESASAAEESAAAAVAAALTKVVWAQRADQDMVSLKQHITIKEDTTVAVAMREE